MPHELAHEFLSKEQQQPPEELTKKNEEKKGVTIWDYFDNGDLNKKEIFRNLILKKGREKKRIKFGKGLLSYLANFLTNKKPGAS